MLLANRALAYLKYSDIYNALQDCNRALSPEFTTADSPVKITAKCHLRRSKIKSIMVMWEEARTDYEAFVTFQEAAGLPVSEPDRQLMAEIQQALDRPRLSRKDKLIHAVQVCPIRQMVWRS